jgi:uncharacterized membrane protein
MPTRHTAMIGFLLLAFIVLAEFAYYLPQLPDQLASHFDLIEGQAVGWSDKPGFVVATTFVVLILGAIFLTAGWLDRLPRSLVNLPNRTYWLALERRAATFARIRDWLRWFMVLTLMLITAITGLVLRANLTSPPRLSQFALWLVIGYLLLAVMMTVMLIQCFRIPRT